MRRGFSRSVTLNKTTAANAFLCAVARNTYLRVAVSYTGFQDSEPLVSLSKAYKGESPDGHAERLSASDLSVEL